MPIARSTPFVVPAVAEKTFPHDWVRTFRVETPQPSAGRIIIETVPHNGDTGETLPQPAEVITCDLWEVAQAVPSAGAAMAAVLAAIPDIRAYVAAHTP